MRGSTPVPQVRETISHSRRSGNETIVYWCLPSRSGEGGARRWRDQFRNERGMVSNWRSVENMRRHHCGDDWHFRHDQRTRQMAKHAVTATLTKCGLSQLRLAVARHLAHVYFAAGRRVGCRCRSQRRRQGHDRSHRAGQWEPDDHAHHQQFSEKFHVHTRQAYRRLVQLSRHPGEHAFSRSPLTSR